MKIKLLILLVVLIVSGCRDGERPFRPINMPPLPKGSPEYTQGWEDGCQSGMAVYGDNTYKTIYKWTQDLDLVKNTTYYKAWKDSYNYCRHFMQTFNNSLTTPSVKFLPFDSDSKDPLFDDQPDFLGIPGETSFGSYGDIFGGMNDSGLTPGAPVFQGGGPAASSE